MSKYSPAQLKQMALVVIDDEVAGGFTALKFYIQMAMVTGLEPMEIRRRTYEYANS